MFHSCLVLADTIPKNDKSDDKNKYVYWGAGAGLDNGWKIYAKGKRRLLVSKIILNKKTGIGRKLTIFLKCSQGYCLLYR